MNKPFVKNDISSIDSIETTERHTRIENINPLDEERDEKSTNRKK